MKLLQLYIVITSIYLNKRRYTLYLATNVAINNIYFKCMENLINKIIIKQNNFFLETI